MGWWVAKRRGGGGGRRRGGATHPAVSARCKGRSLGCFMGDRAAREGVAAWMRNVWEKGVVSKGG